jgi:hypothetical protein
LLTKQDGPHDLAEDLSEYVHTGGVHPRLPVLVAQVIKEFLQKLRVVDAANNFLQRITRKTLFFTFCVMGFQSKDQILAINVLDKGNP